MPAKIACFAAAALVASALAAHAEPSRIQQFDDWGVYSYPSASGTVCYALSMPKTMAPSGIDHGKNYFLVSPAGGKGGGFVPEAVMGYALKAGGPVSVSVGETRFAMVAKGNAAWTESPAQDPALVAALQGGAEMTVSATSKRGTATRYTYSLSGISAALKKVAACP